MKRNKSKIAFICAHAEAHNTGMLSVDMAAYSLVEQLRDCVEADFFNVEVDHSLFSRGEAVFKYKKLTSLNQLLPYDSVVLWGDFLSCGYYHRKDLKNRAKKRGDKDVGCVKENDFLPSAELLRVSNASCSFLSKFICFGGSLFGNDSFDEIDGEYKADLSVLYKNAKLVMVRDPISAMYVARYTDWKVTDSLGIDAAWLLKPSSVLSWSERSEKGGEVVVGYSFGRAIAKSEELLKCSTDFVRKFGDAISGSQSVKVIDLKWLSSKKEDPLGGLSNKLGVINSCDYVVTDTYHCAINSWREGVPTVCIGMGGDEKSGTLTEKKKEYLYSAFNIRDFYVYSEWLASGRQDQVIKKLVNKLSDKKRIDCAVLDMGVARDSAMMRLKSALSGEC
ncbi:polysaccharide pyruvyl transferase family protein [Halomonas sp. BM-2019]|uniref:polysaccharide pyruvyl transferase family protein n=1 Tax=Halomonas sp. BM-2019 TaxID=2811227 RepID=UPI001B3C4755|nr:MAG: polysaccharide pyruvyl transferase family protein [Halomonas sp. BM-2019]